MQSLLAAGFGAACVLNADSPTLPTAALRRAAALLAAPGERVVLGPADDGGYYLLGMTAPHAALFTDIAWSTADVAEQTRAAAASHGLELVELETWYDVDDRAALRRLLAELAPAAGPLDADAAAASGEIDPATFAGDAYAAPATVACVARLRLHRLIGEMA